MLAAPAVLALAAGTSVASMGLGFAQAQAQNRSIKASAANAVEANRINTAQTKMAGEDQVNKIGKSFNRYQQALLASAGERGVGSGGSTRDLEMASLSSALSDQANTEFNTQSSIWANEANTASHINRLYAGVQSPWMSGLSQGINTFGNVFQLGTGVSQLIRGY